jgi:hypothetical protein
MGVEGLDEDYLSSVADLPKEGDTKVEDGQQQQQQDDPNKGTPADKNQQQKVEGDQQKIDDKQPLGAKKDDKQQQQQQQKLDKDGKPIVERQITKAPNGNLIDERGNIVDEHGVILAAAGKARRTYEENGRLKETNRTLAEKAASTELQLREVNYLNGVPAKFGLSNDEVATALDYAGRMKRGDLLGVAKDILAQIAAAGHNVSDLLGKDVGDSIDMKAVTALLDRRLGPITQQREQQTQDNESMVAARAAYNDFLENNENADVHEDAIARLAKTDGISPQAAYNRLYKFAVDNGLDFNEPLGPQVLARREQQQQQDNGNQNRQQQQQQRPLPGKNAQTRADGVQPQVPQYANADDDWGTIIGRAMQSTQ